MVVCTGLALAGCGTASTSTLFEQTIDSLRNEGKPAANLSGGSRSLFASDARSGFTGAQVEGSNTFVASVAPSINAGTTRAGEEGYTLNLLGAPVAIAAKSVLGDILHVNYTIDPRVEGTVSLQTSDPVNRDDLVELFETALSIANVSIVRKGAGYQLVPSSMALGATPGVSVPSLSGRGPGVIVQVIELRNIAAEEMQTILTPISREGSILRVDTKRNYIVIAGTQADLRAIRDAINVFDVDAMRGQSVALHPLKQAKPGDVVRELENIFGVENGKSGVVRFIANDRLNSVLVITSRSAYLQRASAWIRKLDSLANSSDAQLFVYHIQNRPARELAGVLQSVLSGASSTGTTAASQVSPDQDAVALGADPAALETMAAGQLSDASVVADTENNALLISTNEREYKRIERILAQLDVLPTQVLLEAVIAEVTLNDELKFGLRWAVESGNFNFNFSDLATGLASASFPGAAFGFATDNIQVTLNALASITDVNVISSPTLMALNNQQAILQVGDQVPIVTQQATNTVTVNAPVVNSVALKDTGIILKVLPRVNASGRILLDIDQEVSSVVKTTSSGIDSPTIQQRKISTKVVVNDGESLALGGLIQERNNLQRAQVPVLGNIPLLGNAFKNKTDSIARTELIIFIRPRVVRNVEEARDVTAEFRDRLGFNSAIGLRRGGTPLQQDLRRLAY
ncbi:type II secretion system protein D (GspD) [Hoeflea marina]|uniref:Type II secretion system protein D (GspD) n=1 Tax=Hoeflea marina TaxID=274592 RepID=A0A317PKP2_9HYPH|nr:type II secretion system secretin GspD [Hoeflea marina]PWW01522.1 type II secretion system protein D (GspD) [Hoeflea marina]